jgi:hypothetical protein
MRAQATRSPRAMGGASVGGSGLGGALRTAEPPQCVQTCTGRHSATELARPPLLRKPEPASPETMRDTDRALELLIVDGGM